MRFLQIATFLGLLCLASAVQDIAFYNERSGDIIITKDGLMDDDSFVYVLENNGIMREMSNEEDIDEISVADYISHLLGTPVINEQASRQSFAKGNIFNKAKANLFLVVDSLGENELSQIPALKVLQKPGQKMSLRRNAFPQDNLATLASLVTGQTPSVHGIVNKEWFTAKGVAQAYKAKALPQSASFIDVVSQTFSGQSLTVSGSSDFQMASALGAHQFLRAQNPSWNNFAASWNTESGSYESVYSVETTPFSFSHSKLIKNLSTRKFAVPLRFNVDTFDVVVSPQGQESITFSLKGKQNFHFFGEMEYLYYIVDQIQADEHLKALVADNIPDLFSFGFASLNGMAERHGRNSAEFKAAVMILDSVLADVIDQFSQVYGNKLTVEIVFISSNSAYETIRKEHDDIQFTVYQLVKNIVLSEDIFYQYFPHVYAVDKSLVTVELCERLDRYMKDGYHAICSGLTDFPHIERMLLADSNSTVEYPEGHFTEAAEFQIVLWFAIAIILTLIAIVYAMVNMDIGADSMIYRLTTLRR